MSFKLRIAIRVIKRRVAAGETLEAVFVDYPGLTTEERKIVEKEVRA